MNPIPETERAEAAVPILMVDDRPENLDALAAMLKDPQYEPIRAGSGEEALKLLLTRVDFAVILLDVQLGGMDGFETARQVRGREKTRYIPIIFLTAFDKDEADILKGYDMGAVDYILKPVIPRILKAKVAIFAELFRKSRAVKQQEAEKHREAARRREAERRQRELETTLADLREMAGRKKKSAGAGGTIPLEQRRPKAYREILSTYGSLMDRYLAAKAGKGPMPGREISRLAEQLHSHWCGARDLVEIHVKTITGKTETRTAGLAAEVAMEGRLLVLEAMGNLLEIYRRDRGPAG